MPWSQKTNRCRNWKDWSWRPPYKIISYSCRSRVKISLMADSRGCLFVAPHHPPGSCTTGNRFIRVLSSPAPQLPVPHFPTSQPRMATIAKCEWRGYAVNTKCGVSPARWDSPKEDFHYLLLSPALPCIFLPHVGHWYTALPWPSAHTRVIGILSWLLSQYGVWNSAIFSFSG